MRTYNLHDSLYRKVSDDWYAFSIIIVNEAVLIRKGYGGGERERETHAISA
jgi:hypothetical protein